jgi:hypothetical protein
MKSGRFLLPTPVCAHIRRRGFFPFAHASLLIRDHGAARTSEMEDFVAFESCFFAPAPEVRAAEIKRIAELDEHVEGRQQAEGVFAPIVVDDILHYNERAVFRQGIVSRLDQGRMPEVLACISIPPYTPVYRMK